MGELLELRVLGPLEAVRDGRPIALGGPRQRAVLALLVVNANRVVSTDRLIEAVWNGDPPANALGTLQGYVSRLRKAVGAEALPSAAGGYELRIDADAVDLQRFERLAARGRERLEANAPREAARLLRDALGLWRGEPFGDLAYESWAVAEAARLEESRLAALEDRIEADLRLGRHGELVGEVELLVSKHPTRERLRAQLMLALYRSGRQAEALEAYHAARATLVEELGLEPGRALQELQQAILRQDPALEPAGPEEAEAPLSTSGLVGREAELAELRGALASALAGRGLLAVVTGEAGIGKTRIAEELAALADEGGALALWGRCWEAGGAPPYWPWTQAARAYATAIDADDLRRRHGPRLDEATAALPPLRALLPELPALAEPPEDRFAVFASVAGFLRREAAERPLVFCLDDLQAADVASLLLLRFLADELRDAAVLLLALWRTPLPADAEGAPILSDLAARADVRVVLEGLGASAIAALVERTTGVAPTDEVALAFEHDTRGNPFFVLELARLTATTPEAESRALVLADVIGRRLSALPETCRDLLEHAAVVGREFDLPTLARVSGLADGELLDAIDAALGERVLEAVSGELGRFRFAHALVREALYEGLPAGRRAQLHRRVGEALEDLHAADLGPHLSELARHYVEAAATGTAREALAYSRAAADRAVGELAFEEGARLYRTAIRVAGLGAGAVPAERCELHLALGDALGRSGDSTGARSAFLRAAEIARAAGLAEHLGRAALGAGGRFAWRRAYGDTALVALLEDALSELGPADTALRARLLARLAGALRDEPERSRRDELSAEAVAVARRLDDPVALSYALEARWNCVWWPENVDERLAVATEMVELAPRTRDRERTFEAHNHRAASLLEAGRAAEAQAEFRRAERAAEALRQPAQRWKVATWRALRALMEGRLDDAELLVHEAFAIGEQPLGEEAAVCFRSQLYLLRLEQGRQAEVEPLLVASLDEHPNRRFLAFMLAHLYATTDRPAETARLLRHLASAELADLPRDNEWLFALSFLPEACAAAEALDLAGIAYALLLPFERQIAIDLDDGCTGSIARPLGLLAAQLGRYEDAQEHLLHAVEHNEELGLPTWAERSRRERELLDG